VYALNPTVCRVPTPPVSDAAGWVAGRAFPAERPLLDVAQAVPNYPPAEALVEQLASVLGRPETALYTHVYGLPALREALARHMSAAYAASIDADRVLITAGCNQAFCMVLGAIARPGDEVLLPLPYYFNHHMWLESQGIGARYLPFSESRGAVPDPAGAEPLLSERTRAIVLVTPNNPTGAIYPPDVIEAFFELARGRGLALVVDETYKDFRDSDAPAHALFARSGWEHTLVQLYSFSKVFSMTGYRVGSIVAAPELLHEVAKLVDCVSICAPRVGQLAALHGLEHLQDWRARKTALMHDRVRALVDAFSSNELRYELVSAGAYFAYVRHPFEQPSLDVARRLVDEQHVLSLPGSMFGPGQNRYLRFAFGNLEAQQMPQLVARLVASQQRD